MKRFVLALLAALSLLRPMKRSPASKPSWTTGSAATGGRAAWDSRHNLVEHATLDFAKHGLKGTLTIYQAAPDKYLGLTELPGIGQIATGSNGEVAWENTALQGPRLKQGAEKADAFREGAFNGDLIWQKLYVKGETAASKPSEGHECYKIVLTPKEGKPVTEFFDKTSGLLMKTTTIVTSQLGEIARRNPLRRLSERRRRPRSPHRLVNRAAQQEFVIQIQSIEANADLPEGPLRSAARNPGPAEQSRAATSPQPARSMLAGSDTASSPSTWQAIPLPPKTTPSRNPTAGIDIDGSGSASLGPMKIDIEKFEVLTDAKYRASASHRQRQAGPDPDERAYAPSPMARPKTKSIPAKVRKPRMLRCIPAPSS